MRILKWLFSKNKTNKQLEIDFLKLPQKAQLSRGLRPIIDHARKCGYKITKVNYQNGCKSYGQYLLNWPEKLKLTIWV